jgi:hypothetical protein
MPYPNPIYPTNIPTYTDLRVVTNDIDDYIDTDHNDLMCELISSLSTLGTLPQGTFATVKDRLDYLTFLITSI